MAAIGNRHELLHRELARTVVADGVDRHPVVQIVRRSRRGYGVAADDFGYFLVVFFAGAFLAGAAFRVRVRSRSGIVKLSEVGAVANHISLMRHI